MDLLAKTIVRWRKLIAVAFLALIVFSVFSIPWVTVEKEITKYLPDGAAAKQGLNVMEQELEMYASATVLVRDIGQEDARALGEKIASQDGILQLSFDANSEKCYKDSSARYGVTFSGTADKQSAIDGMDNLKNTVAEYNHVVLSDSFSSYSDKLTEQMAGVLGLVAILVVIVLLLTSTTYAEVPVFLGTFIAAAIINMGTNFLMGSISFVSNSVAVVLQLALSVDYAIILCNRYKEEHQTKEIKEAVESALARSIPAISASSLTTIAGLTAMGFMQFQLGLDMSIALIKAIVISLLTVFLLMPFLLCLFGKWMDKTKHRSFIPRVDFLGKFAYATRFIIPPIFVVFAIFAYVSFGTVQYDFNGSYVNIFSESEERAAEREMSEIFGDNNTVALLVPSGDYAKEMTLAKKLEKTSGVTGVTSIATIEAKDGYCLGDSVSVTQFMSIANMDETSSKALFAYHAAKHDSVDGLDLNTYQAPLIELFTCAHELAESGQAELSQSDKDAINEIYGQLSQALDQLQGDNFSCLVVQNSYPPQGEKAYDFIDSVVVMAKATYGTDEVYITGDQVSSQGFASTFSSDMQLVSMLSMALVMLILLLTYRSVAMPILLIVVIQGSILINFSLAAWTNSYVFFMCYLIVSSIQMGANIDYAIVISTRYSEMRSKGLALQESMIATLNLAFPTVLTSGAMMVFSGALIALRISDEVIAGMGQYVATGTVITLLLVNFVLPQILMWGDKLVQATTIRVHITPRMRKAFQAVSCGAFLVAIAFAVSLPFTQTSGIRSATDDAVSTANEMEQFASDLSKLATNVGETDVSFVQYQYAEQLLTDQIGSKELASGQEQYDQGAAAVASAKNELNAGEAEYQDALAQYYEGQQKLIDGKERYDQGLARLNAAEAEYADGQARIATARKDYADGKAAIAAAKVEYAEGEQRIADAQEEYDQGQAQLDRVRPLYNMVYPLYRSYEQLQEEYDQAVERGDTRTAAVLYRRLQVAKVLFETQLSSTGYSLEQLVTEYQEGQRKLEEGAAELEAGRAKLAAAAQEIADGERQLAEAKIEIDKGQYQLDVAARDIAEGKQELEDGKAELVAGYAQLAEAESQLAAGRAELDSGHLQLADGEKELADSGKELEDGKKLLSDNKEKLNDSIASINSLSDDNEKLKNGISLLMSFPAVKQLAGNNASYVDLCAAAKDYFVKVAEDAEKEAQKANLLIFVLLVAAAVGCISCVFFLFRRKRISRWFALVSAALALPCVVLWSGANLFGSLPFGVALALVITAVIFALVISIVNKVTSTDTLEAVAAPVEAEAEADSVDEAEIIPGGSAAEIEDAAVISPGGFGAGIENAPALAEDVVVDSKD